MAARVVSAAQGKLVPCVHTNTSAAAGFRGPLEGWAKAGIKYVELNAALKVTREAAHPNFGILFDCYHFWSGLNKLEDMDQIRPGEIQHVHFQGVPDMPRELLDNESRFIPGDGVSPLNAMLRRPADKGYAGPLSVGLFLPKFEPGNPYEIAREIREKCEAAMSKAGIL